MDTVVKLPSVSVLIPDGETWDTVKVLRCLRQTPSIMVHILSKNQMPLAQFSRYCESSHCHKSINDEEWVDATTNLIRRLKIDVVLPVTDKGVEFVVRNHQIISKVVAVPPLPDPEILKVVQDKWSLYQFVKKHGLPVVPSTLIGIAGGSVPELPAPGTVEYPALLKPTSEGGGFGIVKVQYRNDFYHAWGNKRVMKGSKYILQSYIPGVDLCLHVFCKKGEVLAYTLQRDLLSPNNYFGPQRAMEFINDEMVIDLGKRLVSALKWNGIACIDFRIDSRDEIAKILEVNPRFGQAILGSLVAGVNFPLMSCLHTIGEKYPDMKYRTTRYAHPAAYWKMLISKLIGKRVPVKIRWKESGLRFTCGDPLPELVGAMCKTIRKLKQWIVPKQR